MCGISLLLRRAMPVFIGLACYLQEAQPARADASPVRQPILFDRDWRFRTGDAPGAEAPGFDDSAWRQLSLPHDWMIEGVQSANPADMDGPFDRRSPAGPGGAYLDGGIGWYRKTFTMPAADQGKEITLLFDGAYSNADVWLNGQHLGTHPYGFTSFYYDITPALKFGAEKNVLAVKLNVQQPSCRWYSGAGIYRDVWLIETGAGACGQVGDLHNHAARSRRDSAQVRVQDRGGKRRRQSGDERH